MNTEDPFGFFNLVSAESDSVTVDLLVIKKDGTVARINRDNDLDAEFKNIFFDTIVNYMNEAPDSDIRVKTYNPALKPDYDVIWKLPRSEVPVLDSLKDDLEKPLDDIPLVEDEDSLGDFKGFIARIKTSEHKFMVFQKLSQAHVLKGGGKIRLIFRGSSFSKLEASALQIYKHNTGFILEENIYFFEAGQFEYVFSYFVKKQENATQRLREIEDNYSEHITLPNGKTLSDIAGSKVQLINKLQNISQFPSISSIKQQISDFAIKLELKDDTIQLTSPREVKDFVKIINDDYLKSTITNQKYTIHSKDKIS